MTDSQKLLAEYVQTGSETAFRELVARYLDLVYSAALRLVEGDTHRAEDVAQTVFVDLARQARTLSPDVMPGGWLHQHTCFVAAKTMRGERRRQSRERQAVEMNALQDHPEANLARIAPILDDVINQLGDADRTAILLRFFEQRDFRSVGEVLGSNEDAARMRVTRVLEKLHFLLKRRGVTMSATALTITLSTNAVQAAPAGLDVTVSAAALLTGTAVHTSTAIAATKIIAMTTIQKTLIATTLAAVAGTGIYEAHQASSLRRQNELLQQRQAPLTEQIQKLQRERDDVTKRLAALQAENEQLKSNQNTAELLKLRGEVARLRNDANDLTDASAKALMAKMNKLKQRLAETPDAKIPELQFVTEQDWLNAANGKLDTEADYRRALASLRSAAESKVGSMFQKALKAYLQSSGGQMPTDLGQLQPYFDLPMDDAILQRWEIAPASTVQSLDMGGDVIITQKAPVDDVFDTRYGIGPNGFGSTDFLPNETFKTMKPVFDAYRAAHNGQWQTEMSQLLPYATTPEQQTALQKLILKNSAGN